MVGSLGQDEMAAIAGGLYCYHLPLAFGSGLLISVNTLGSQSFGQRYFLECRRICVQGFYVAVTLGLLFLVLIPFAPWLFRFLGHPTEVQQAESQYLQFMLIALAPHFIAVAANNFFFAISRPQLAMFVSLSALLANALLNYIFIFGHFGSPALGIVGAATASILVATLQATTLIVLVLRSAKSVARVPLRLWFFRPSGERLRRLLKVGAPNGVHECVEVAIWSVAIVVLIGRFGSAPLAAAALILTIVDILYAPIEGFGGAMTALVGRDVGAGRHDFADHWTRIGLRITLPFTAFASLLCFALHGPMMNLLGTAPDVSAIASQTILLLPVIMISFAAVAVYDYALVGAGDTLWPMAAHLSANFLFIIVGGLVLVTWFPEAGPIGIWTLACVALVFVAGLFVLRWRGGLWKTISVTTAEPTM